MTTSARDHYLADHARVAAALPGGKLPWLARLRAGALDAFAGKGFPTRHDEQWKYTSVAGFEKHGFLAAPFAGPETGDAGGARAVFDRFTLDKKAAHLLVFHNGHYSPALSSPGQLP
ncbi:MAG: Fe-S cluster assembly protein SufD, partial [Polaromonas sp.]